MAMVCVAITTEADKTVRHVSSCAIVAAD